MLTFTLHQVNLTALSTEFANPLDYQKVMSQLVFTEILASLQQELDINKHLRDVVYFGGKVGCGVSLLYESGCFRMAIFC